MGCIPNRSRVQAIEVSQRLSLSPEALGSPYISKRTIHAVTPQELRLIGKLFRDLATRSTGERIDKTTFLLFFPLPVGSRQGLWGERLFDKFAFKGTGKIDYEEFARGLAQGTKTTQLEKLQLLFSLYDLRGDGYIDKPELVSMVLSTQMLNTYKHTMRTTPVSEVTVDPPEENRESVSSAKRMERKMSTASIHRDDFAMPDKIDELAGKIMSDLDATDKLNFEQFSKYVAANPRIMDVFTAVFREELWSTSITELPASSTILSPSRRRHRCFGCCLPRSASMKVHTNATATFFQEKSGWLTRKGKEIDLMAKQFAVLRTNMLLLFLGPSAPIPSQVIFLEGCYIDRVTDYTPGQKFGFMISHQYEGFREYNFWCGSKDEREEWVQRLEAAAKSRRVDEFYEFKDRLGSGKFSDVYSVIEKQTDFRWAIKVIDKKRLNDSEREMLRSEIAIMRLLNHPNVVEMKEVFEDKNKMYVVMELVEGGELFDRIRRKKVFSEYMAYHITKQLLEIIHYLHDVGIVHRDIKPENILLSDDSEIPTIKLADFGLSILVGPNDELRVPCGTLGYVAPEVLQQHPYGKPVDLWSTGIVAYLMLRGKLPFDSKDKQTLVEKSIEAKIDLTGPYWAKCTSFSKDFLSKLLTKDPRERLTCEQALSHSWMKNGDILIPRKINRRAVEEDLLMKTITTAKMQPQIYDENPKSASLDHVLPAGDRMIYTTPDIFEDMEVERKQAEHQLALQCEDV